MDYNIIRLNLRSNLTRYNISIYCNDERYSQIIYGQHSTLCLKTKSKHVLVILSPLDDGYYDKLYVKINTLRCEQTISHNFLKRSIQEKVYRFSLSDANYGLKLDGFLNFKSI